MNRVKIFVVAEPNKGKTTIAHIVKDALINWGFVDVMLIDMPPVAPDKKEPIQVRAEAAKKRPVEIEVATPESLRKLMSSDLCERCKLHPVAYNGARFCGAACSAQYEAGI